MSINNFWILSKKTFVSTTKKILWWSLAFIKMENFRQSQIIFKEPPPPLSSWTNTNAGSYLSRTLKLRKRLPKKIKSFKSIIDTIWEQVTTINNWLEEKILTKLSGENALLSIQLKSRDDNCQTLRHILTKCTNHGFMITYNKPFNNIALYILSFTMNTL